MSAQYTFDQAVEEAVLAYMLVRAYKQAKREGWELRDDVLQSLRTAAQKPITYVGSTEITRFALSVERGGSAGLDALTGYTGLQALQAVSYFILLCVENGVVVDPRGMAVLVALTLVEEAKEDPSWYLEEHDARRRAEKIETRLRLLGLFYSDPKVFQVAR